MSNELVSMILVVAIIVTAIVFLYAIHMLDEAHDDLVEAEEYYDRGRAMFERSIDNNQHALTPRPQRGHCQNHHRVT